MAYELKKIIDWRNKVQSKIEALIAKESLKLKALISEQMKEGDTIKSNMGLVWIDNKNGEDPKEVGAWIDDDDFEKEMNHEEMRTFEEFLSELGMMQYSHYFEAAPDFPHDFTK